MEVGKVRSGVNVYARLEDEVSVARPLLGVRFVAARALQSADLFRERSLRILPKSFEMWLKTLARSCNSGYSGRMCLSPPETNILAAPVRLSTIIPRTWFIVDDRPCVSDEIKHRRSRQAPAERSSTAVTGPPLCASSAKPPSQVWPLHAWSSMSATTT